MRLTSLDLSTLYDVKQILDDNTTKPKMSFSDLTRLSGFNKDKLSKSFKTVFGASIAQYQIRRRMELAAQLLVSTDLLVKEIAYQVGYPQLNKFTPHFKHFFGQTPTEYRQSLQKHNYLHSYSGQ